VCNNAAAWCCQRAARIQEHLLAHSVIVAATAKGGSHWSNWMQPASQQAMGSISLLLMSVRSSAA
jgi:hypothetical protein